MSREDIVATTMRMAEAISNGGLGDVDNIFDGAWETIAYEADCFSKAALQPAQQK